MHELLEKYYEENGRRRPECVVENIESMSNFEWRIARQSGIGGSDAGPVYYGTGKFKTAFEVSISKTEELKDEEPSIEDEYRFGYGHMVEDLLAKFYQRTTGAKVFVDRGMYRNPEHPCMQANCDGFAVLPDGLLIGLEFKSTSPYNKDLWREGVYGQGAEIGVMDYFVQVQHYMAIMDIDRFDILVDFKDGSANSIKVVTVHRDQLFIDSLIDKEEWFWEHIEEIDLPEMISAKNAEKAVEVLKEIGAEIEDVESNIESINDLKEKKSYLEKQVKEIEQRINAEKIAVLVALGEREKVDFGKYIVSNKKIVSLRYDTKEMKKHPELDVYLVESSYSKFDIKSKRIEA
ncbi:MAG: YqaJ viral recombinase family protein [Erysipelotrichaceae bacterium]|nr:YqaJ viral recombinase family protein [Erysipelotrichaceae bacterium]